MEARAAMSCAQFISDLKAAVGSGNVLQKDRLQLLDPGFHMKNLAAMTAVLPGSAKEVAAVLEVCAREQVSVVPQGGRTGLAGGAASSPGQILIFADRLNEIHSIDPQGQVADVGAGVRLETLQAAARDHGLSPGIDLAARGSATIGGMIATNAGGNEAFRHGVMRHRVLGLEVVLPTCEILSDLKRVTKVNEGYDLKHLFIGSEGTLGVVTRATVKLEVLDANRATALAACADAEHAVALLSRFQHSHTTALRAAEIMWRNFARTSASALNVSALSAFLDTDAQVFVIIDVVDGGTEGREAFQEELGAAAEAGELQDAIVAGSERERGEIWQVREDSWSIDRAFPHGLWYDVSVPLGALDGYIGQLTARIRQINHELSVFAMGHLGDGNLHLTITAGRPIGELYDAVSHAVYDGLAGIGGSISAEHGVGTEKLSALSAHVAPEKLQLMRTIKRAIDPLNIMNPGKVLAN